MLLKKKKNKNKKNKLKSHVYVVVDFLSQVIFVFYQFVCGYGNVS